MQLEGTKLGSKLKLDEAAFKANNELEGVRVGADIAKNRAMLAAQSGEKNDRPVRGNPKKENP